MGVGYGVGGEGELGKEEVGEIRGGGGRKERGGVRKEKMVLYGRRERGKRREMKTEGLLAGNDPCRAAQ